MDDQACEFDKLEPDEFGFITVEQLMSVECDCPKCQIAEWRWEIERRALKEVYDG